MPPNISMFSAEDAYNISLQRTDHIKFPFTFKLWAKGYPFALKWEAGLRKSAIINGAIADAKREFEQIAEYLGARPIKKIVDIGCGHALIDLFMWEKYQCDIHLVDIETTETHHHGYKDSGAGYASLEAAKNYLVANGVPAAKIEITNPQVTPLVDKNCDFIFSLLSCGFHYPAATYADFVAAALKPGGVFLFDLRKKSDQEDFLKGFARFEVVMDEPKYRRVAAVKG